MMLRVGTGVCAGIFAGICFLLAIALPGLAATRVPVEAVRWQAVLVAGDNAQPVFDNAVTAFRDWLASIGVPASNIHQLSANAGQRDQAVEPANVAQLQQR